ncbi:hypothetical protein [Desulfitobacterium chlororespirans]|uniref:Uncharacterized protein n=1 Tax=Desulfitobacterium chlororespirans DSM 11544 TaxID=1121395 RepID=A0A1M7UZC4_9FIRM|nr:hypothetical protein [Desulfitobacterium chlororespirans]SHN88353.1 hypothetical protein SAMN02745215_05288 [Desulfitobacterium chlororespirans DSM 11544]
MAFLTTGLIDNTPVFGVRPSSSLSVLVTSNVDTLESVLLRGYYLSGNSKVLYVEELFTIGPAEVKLRDYYANLDGIEFQFIVSSQGVNATLWGKDAEGNLQTAHRVVAQELDELDI